MIKYFNMGRWFARSGPFAANWEKRIEEERILSRLTLIRENKSQVTVESLSKDLERRIVANPTSSCPVDLTSSFIKMCLAQSCGKCVP